MIDVCRLQGYTSRMRGNFETWLYWEALITFWWAKRNGRHVSFSPSLADSFETNSDGWMDGWFQWVYRTLMASRLVIIFSKAAKWQELISNLWVRASRAVYVIPHYRRSREECEQSSRSLNIDRSQIWRHATPSISTTITSISFIERKKKILKIFFSRFDSAKSCVQVRRVQKYFVVFFHLLKDEHHFHRPIPADPLITEHSFPCRAMLSWVWKGKLGI